MNVYFMSFARYAAIVKNLRGVVLADIDEDGVWSSVMWLVNRFRYRDLGVVPSVVKRYRSLLERYLNGNPFRELVSPTGSIQIFIERLGRASGLPLEVVELLALSSAYVSPAIVIGNRYSGYLKEVSTDVVNVCKDMDTNSWKLHLRIADYTILDIYEASVGEVLNAIEKGVSRELLEKISDGRRSVIEADKKRYWRIACDSGKPFLYYVDMVNIVLRYYVYKDLVADHAACLSIVPVVMIPPNMK